MNTQNYPTWLVPLAISKELKEIGFNEPCLVTYKEVFDEEMIFISFEGDDYCYYYAELSECSQRTNSEMGKDILKTGKHYSYACSIPTWTDVLAWFRKRGLYGFITFDNTFPNSVSETFSFEIRKINRKLIYGSEENSTDEFNCYEEAREALAFKLIEIYKTQIITL